METLIDQDFEFNKFSLIYGQFLQEVHESYPDVKITDVARHYTYKDQYTIFIHVAVPEEIAVILKLRFGACLRNRPPPKPEPEYKDEEIKEEYEKSIWERESYFKKRIYIRDYLDILKTKEAEKLYSEVKMESLYHDLKSISLDTDWLKDEK